MEKRSLNAAYVFPLFVIGISLTYATATEKIIRENYIKEDHQMDTYTKMVTVRGNKNQCLLRCNLQENCTAVGVEKIESRVNCYLMAEGSAESVEVDMEQRDVEVWRKDPGCPESFLTTLDTFPGCYYSVLTFADSLPFQQAEDACQALDSRAHLISLETVEEQDAMKDFMWTAGTGQVLTGGKDISGTFVWIGTGEDMSLEAERWYPGDPGGRFGDCVFLQGGVMHVEDCTRIHRYICEITMTP